MTLRQRMKNSKKLAIAILPPPPQQVFAFQPVQRKISDQNTNSLVDAIITGLHHYRPEREEDRPVASVEVLELDDGGYDRQDLHPEFKPSYLVAADESLCLAPSNASLSSPSTNSDDGQSLRAPSFSPFSEPPSPFVHRQHSTQLDKAQAVTFEEAASGVKSQPLQKRADSATQDNLLSTGSDKDTTTDNEQPHPSPHQSGETNPGHGLVESLANRKESQHTTTAGHFETTSRAANADKSHKSTPPIADTHFVFNSHNLHAEHAYYRDFLAAAQRMEALHARLQNAFGNTLSLQAEGTELLQRAAALLSRTEQSDSTPAGSRLTLRQRQTSRDKKSVRFSNSSTEGSSEAWFDATSEMGGGQAAESENEAQPPPLKRARIEM